MENQQFVQIMKQVLYKPDFVGLFICSKELTIINLDRVNKKGEFLTSVIQNIDMDNENDKEVFVTVFCYDFHSLCLYFLISTLASFSILSFPMHGKGEFICFINIHFDSENALLIKEIPMTTNSSSWRNLKML